MSDTENTTTVPNPKYRTIRIPKQDFLSKRSVIRPSMDNSIVRELREVFEKFSDTIDVNPHTMKNALRSVGKHNVLNFRFPQRTPRHLQNCRRTLLRLRYQRKIFKI